MVKFNDDSVRRLENLLRSRPADVMKTEGLRHAAVLIPLVRADGEWSLLFQRRSDDLPVHRGQVAFPGGALEPGETVEAAAVRETEEETGVPASAIRLIGRLDELTTRTGYLVTPIVAVIPESVRYTAQQSEVTDIFEVPMARLLSAGNPTIRWVAFRGEEYPAYSWSGGTHEIWGLTGRILKSFIDLVWRVI